MFHIILNGGGASVPSDFRLRANLVEVMRYHHNSVTFTFTPGGSGGAEIRQGGLYSNGVIASASYTVTTLPPPTTATLAYVTDATVRTPDTVPVGGGSNGRFVQSDGTDWRII